jgi:uncharacterized protein YdeI (YjbR/CyaY-like superfamily)
MSVQDDAERIEPSSAEATPDWLAEHHGRGSGVWLVSARRDADRAFSYEESVLEALRFGWVDSTQRPVDETRSMMWFAPRRPQSLWTRPNRERIARLEAAGRLEPAGRRAVDAAHANGNWDLLEPAEDGIVPKDLVAAFGRHPGSREQFESFSPSARKAILSWIITAKRPETRADRIEQTAEKAARGERSQG